MPETTEEDPVTARRLLLTAVALAAIVAALHLLAPGPAAVLAALRDPQATVDSAGPGALLLAVIGGVAWLVWGWGTVGLLLTAAGALPGAAGWTARLLVRAVLPAGARNAAAVALGVGMVLQGPLLGGATAFASTPTAAASDAPADPAIPDWPTTDPQPPSPTTPPVRAGHVVVRGDCLWDIAAGQLRTTTGRAPDAADVVGAVSAWWTQNRPVIGTDPDLLLPGQVLTPPATP